MLTTTATKTSRINNTLLISSLLAGALLIGACGDVQEAYSPALSDEDEAVVERIPAQGECSASVKAVAGSTLKGVLERAKHDANPGTPNTIEFEVVTGMFEGICADEPELYVNGNPAKLLRGNGVTTTWLASVDASEPEVLLTAYCGQCKQGVWGATIK